MLGDYNYEKYLDNPFNLANRIVSQLEIERKLKFPIDPFHLLNRFGISYKLSNFDDLEGIYIYSSEEDTAVVGINKNRPITRQRFTAAHEICHHIKDRKLEIITCPIDGRKNDIEKFADSFASELLMPKKYLRKKVKKYLHNGFVSFEDALKISLYFGVSFQACIYALAYREKCIDGDVEPGTLRKRINEFKPNFKIKELNLPTRTLEMKYQLIDNYSFVYPETDERMWYRFKNHYISNEERLEGSSLEESFIIEIITDLRFKKQESEFCKAEYQNIIETAGQVAMFDYIFKTDIKNVNEPLIKLHKKLYKYSMFPEYSGSYRNSNNFVARSNLETSDYKTIYSEMYDIDKNIFKLVESIEHMKNSEVITRALKIHHDLTIIHPFFDGNGRVSRSLLNWLFYLKNLYPVYVDFEMKEKYYEALEYADKSGDLRLLIKFYIDALIESDILLNDLIV